MAKTRSILCYIALLIKHESRYCRIGNLLRNNLG